MGLESVVVRQVAADEYHGRRYKTGCPPSMVAVASAAWVDVACMRSGAMVGHMTLYAEYNTAKRYFKTT